MLDLGSSLSFQCMTIYWRHNSGYQGTVQHNLSKIKKILDSLHSNNIADAADWLRA